MFYAAAAAALAVPFGGIGDYHPKPLATPVTAGVTAAAAQKTYGGHTTSGGGPITIRTSGRHVTDAVIDLRADCDSQHVFPAMLWFSRSSGKSGLPALTGGRLSKRGKFSGGGQVTADLGTQTAAVTATVSGKLGAKRSSGAVAVDIVITDKATGQRVDHCAAQDKWKQTVPERRVLAGVTDQVAPVVIELSRNRKSVKKFWFGFSAQCTPDGSIAPTDVVTNFRIRHKRFGAAFSDEGSDGEGGTLHVDYSLAGKIGRRSAFGKFSVTAVDRDATGAVVSNCPTGDVGWNATQ